MNKVVTAIRRMRTAGGDRPWLRELIETRHMVIDFDGERALRDTDYQALLRMSERREFVYKPGKF
ncbi:hypothetical protein chiPu_0025866, partial [Chiloscyllium punctatum]|nr:hypothetical protein [Chiloscyllium punctatum]